MQSGERTLLVLFFFFPIRSAGRIRARDAIFSGCLSPQRPRRARRGRSCAFNGVRRRTKQHNTHHCRECYRPRFTWHASSGVARGVRCSSPDPSRAPRLLPRCAFAVPGALAPPPGGTPRTTHRQQQPSSPTASSTCSSQRARQQRTPAEEPRPVKLSETLTCCSRLRRSATAAGALASLPIASAVP